MPFTDITLFEIILGSISFIIIMAFGLAVYLKNPKSHTNILFFALSVVLSAYIVSTAIALHPIVKTLESNLFWIRVDMFLGSFIAPLLFLLAHTFPQNKLRLGKKYLVATTLYTIIMAIISFTYLVFKSVSYPEGSSTPLPSPGPGMLFYFAHVIGYFTASFAILIKRYRRSVGQEKIKTAYFLFGIIITFTGMAIVDFLLVLLGNTSLVFLGPNFPVILMSLVGVAIVKHQFLDIKPQIARAVSYTLLVAIIAGIYFMMLFFGFSKFLGLEISSAMLLVTTSFGVIVALTFQPLRGIIMKATDKVFFKGAYNPEKILSELSHEISSTINFNDLSNKLMQTISKELRVDKTAIFLVSNTTVTDARSIGYTNSKLLDDPKLFDFLNQAKTTGKHYFVLDELDDKQKTLFREHDMEALFPIKADGNYVAVLVMGLKSSGLPYSNTDLNLLDVFASESGIAIQNSKLYTELKNALESKSKFINTVSHQLRTPVSGIRWSLEALKAGGSVEHQHELINTSHQKVVFLNEQIDDILIALDIYDKKLSLNKKPCNILDICKNITEDFTDQIVTNNLKITYEINQGAEIVSADFNKLKKVLEILIKNAILYSNQNGEIIVESKIIKNKSKSLVQISITDSGLGISKQEMNHLFEEFYRSDRARLKIPDGLGLGMFIAKTFTEAHGSSIEIKSGGEDMGTSVVTIMPLK